MEQLLTTKFYKPSTRLDLVPRPRLVERLNECLFCKLTLISAPAGFGKTTLVSEWVDGSERPVAWLSLDEGDNDLTRFLAYAIATLRTIEANFAKGALSALQSSQPPPTESVLTSLINDIAAAPDKIIFVLDDYHLIEAQPIHDALTFLLEHLPPQMHLVIVTREDPYLPLSRLRARNQLTELRGADLRFTLSEAAEFLNQVMGLDLSAKDIAALETRTEGWIAGLQLAAISMQGSKDAKGFIESFTGSHRYILDYLLEEVLEQQPEGTQSFLLKTSILDRLTGSLCDALTGQINGQATLEMLERANLFIVRLDNERHWYRYHQLFADLLRQRLHQTQTQQLPILHYRASEWYEQNGFVEEAIEHLMHAEDFERAASLLEEHIDVLWGEGEQSKLQRWLGRLPEEILFSKPKLGIVQARHQCNSGQLDAAERILVAVERALETSIDYVPETGPEKKPSLTHSDKVKLRGRVAATRALICSYQGDVQGIIQHASQALEDLPREDLTWRNVTALTLGNAYGFKGNMAAAYEARFEALKASEAAGYNYFIILANLELAITLREQGRLQRTIEICQQQLQTAEESGLSQTRIVGWLLAVWGETLAELNDLDGALDRAKKGFELTKRSGDLQMLGWSFMCLIRILFSRKELANAEDAIHKMENIARKSNLPPWITNQMKAWQARIWLAQDNLEAASQWMQERGLDIEGESGSLQEINFFLLFDYLVLARILIAQGRLDESTKLLKHLYAAAETGGRTSKLIEVMILQALTSQAIGLQDRAITQLEQALHTAEPCGFIRLFVDEGPPMAQLLYEALSHGIAQDYVRRLLGAFPDIEPKQADRSKSETPAAELYEPLSERELEVLQLVADGLTNQEIAARLYLSLNTVKVHTRNIYGKFGVNNRTQAGARARALGILPRS